jgi:transcriptional regulator with XRE-family HTH domain
VISEKLAEETRELLRSRPAYIKLKEIADKTNIGSSWLSEFSRGKINDPGFEKIAKLYNYLVENAK